MRLWRAIRNHRKTYPNYVTEQQQQHQQQHQYNNSSQQQIPNTTTNEILDELNRNEINRNVHGLTVVQRSSSNRNLNNINNNNNDNSPSVPEIKVQPGSNCNSFDSAATTSSEDYESCNGGHTTGDERMDL